MQHLLCGFGTKHNFVIFADDNRRRGRVGKGVGHLAHV